MCATVAIFADCGLSCVNHFYGLLFGIGADVHVSDMHRCPILKSRSVSEFWAGRWNVGVSFGLRYANYVPILDVTGSSLMAACATFATSGFLHAIPFLCVFMSPEGVVVHDMAWVACWGVFGSFFSQAVILAMERVLRKAFHRHHPSSKVVGFAQTVVVWIVLTISMKNMAVFQASQWGLWGLKLE
eukprot:PhF_6_TR25656/c0_g1_i1/m.36120